MTGTIVVDGDSQGEGILAVLGPIAARHGYSVSSSSWTRAGAGIDEITEHAVHAGPANIGLIFTGGGNDSMSLLRSPAYREKLASLVGTLRFSGIQQIILVGPFQSDDPDVAALHDAARAAQSQGIAGARWIDGYAISAWTAHPAGNPTHWTRAGYQQIALELEKAIWSSGTVTAVGLVGTLTALGGLGILVMESLYSRASDDA